MAWTCSFGQGFLTDDGKFYTNLTTDPPLTGTIFVPPPGSDSVSLTATAPAVLATPQAPLSAITFATIPATPNEPMSMLLTDPTSPGGSGDFFRWMENPWPASPLTLSAVTVPTDSTSLSAQVFQDMINAGLPKTIPLAGPRLLQESAKISSLTLTSTATGTALLNASAAGIAFTALGSFQSSTLGNVTSSISFSVSGELNITPSHDSTNESRVLAVTASGATLTVFGFEPGFIPNLVAGPVADRLAGGVEEGLNTAIADALFQGLGKMGQALMPGSIVSAQRVVVAPAGILIALVLGNIHGAVLKKLPIDIRVSVSPDPVGRTGIATFYTVTVTDTAGNSIPNGMVKLVNFDVRHQTQTITGVINAGSWTTPSAIALHEKSIAHSGVDVAPSVTVTPTPTGVQFIPVTVTLDLTP